MSNNTNLPNGGKLMSADERIVMIYASLRPGYCIVMPVSEWVQYLRDFADLLEQSVEHNTFNLELQSDGSFKLTGVAETWAEIKLRTEAQDTSQ